MIEDRARPSERVAALEAPPHARPHAVEQRDRRLVAELRARPARCRTRSCPSARRARAAPARTGRAPAATASSFSATTPRRARDARTAAPTPASPSAASASRTVSQDRRAARTARRRRSSTRARRAASTVSASSSALHEVAGVHHRAALRARRRRAGTGRVRTAAKNCVCRSRLERAVEPRRPHDHRREVAALVAALHELLGFELRPRRSPCTGCTASPRSKRSSASAFAPNGEFDDTCTNRVAPTRRARSSTSCGAADVHVEELAHDAWRDGSPRRRGTPTRRPMPSNSCVDHRGIAHVADDDLDPRARSPRAAPRRPGSCTRHRMRRAARAARASARDEVLAEPARGAGDDRSRRRPCAITVALLHDRSRANRRRYRLPSARLWPASARARLASACPSAPRRPRRRERRRRAGAPRTRAARVGRRDALALGDRRARVRASRSAACSARRDRRWKRASCSSSPSGC